MIKSFLIYWLLIMPIVSGCVCSNTNNDTGAKNREVTREMNSSKGSEIIIKLVGSWKLASFHSQDALGHAAYPFGKNASGRLIYEAGGRMAVQLMDPDRPRFSTDDPLATSEAEVRSAFGGYTAYYGTYSVDLDNQTITHHIEAALLPNWVETDQKRHFKFDGKYLTIQGPLLLGGVPWIVSLVWERLP
jgi:hypothetical protein